MVTSPFTLPPLGYAYEALEPLGDTVLTGNTGTNLCDFNVLYIGTQE